MTLLKRVRHALQSSLGRSLKPGPIRKSDGQTPADPELRRLPLLVWGDAFLNGDRPQARRALAGADAHECMYTWVYLNELITVREMLRAALGQSYAPPADVDELRKRFELLRSATTDPQSQISNEWPDMFLPAAMFLSAASENKAEYCELGSTFFVSIEKIDLCGRILGRPLDRSKLKFTGIEYSPFMRRVAQDLHPGDQINLVTNARAWQPARPHTIHVSRFVGSYAFRSAAAFADELGRCEAFHIIDVFDLADSDFHSWDLGLPVTLFSLPTVIDRLCDLGFDLYLTKVDPEFHAAGARKAMVGRLFGIRRTAAKQLSYYERFAPLGGFAALFNARRMRHGDGQRILEEVDRSLSAEQWAAFAEYKRFFPIWGGPPGFSLDEVKQLVRSDDVTADLVFDDGQAAHVVRDAIRRDVWKPE